MITLSSKYNEAIGSPRRSVKSKVELYNGSTLVSTFTQSDAISNITIDRVGDDSKFFGFGVSHKLSLQLLDKPRAIEIPKTSALKTYLGLLLDSGSTEYASFPRMYPTEVKRDEKTNTLTIVAYDVLEKAKTITKTDLGLAEDDGYTIRELVTAIATKLEIEVVIPEIAAFDIDYPTGGNFDGTETLYSILTAAAEATQTIFYVNYEDKLVFKKLGEGSAKAVTKDNYFTLESEDAPKLASICAATELGDNVIAAGQLPGKNQYDINALDVSYGCDITEKDTETNSITLTGYAITTSGLDKTQMYAYTLKNTNAILVEYNASKTYTLSCQAVSQSKSGKLYFGVYGSNNGTSWTSITVNSTGIKSNAAAGTTYTLKTTFTGYKYYKFNFYYSTGSSYSYIADGDIVKFSNIQVEEGTTATAFEKYGAMVAMTGETQYVKDNPFWSLREDIADLVEAAAANICGLEINPVACEWRGDFALEPGDAMTFTAKDNSTVTSYLLNDTITYNGGCKQKTEWKYNAEEQQNANPTTLGEMLNKTFARVDKANKEIELVASESSANAAEIAALKLNTDSISASVEKVEKANAEAMESINGEIATLTKQVEATMTSEDVTIAIKSELSNGVNKVTTETGFRFDEEGLTVSKSGSEMTTQITEDGMVVYRDSTPMLTANNEGVNAANLHATTYLIIGDTSRFEDYTDNGEARTGCFWIGG